MPWNDPDRYQLSKYQTNAIYRIITSSEVPVANFQLVWKHDPGLPLLIRPRIYAVIRHSTTESLFAIKKLRKSFYTRQAIGGAAEQKLFPSAWGVVNNHYQKWDGVLADMQQWVGKV
jgi:hypothetical protein